MRRPPTIIYTHGAGRLGNQVIRFAHWIAWARAHPGAVEILNFSFWPFAHFFAQWRQHPGCVFPVRGGWPDRLARCRSALPECVRQVSEKRSRAPRLVQALGGRVPGSQAIALDIHAGEILDLDDPTFLSRVDVRRYTTLSGWRIASWRLVADQERELREYFRPADDLAGPAHDFLRTLRATNELLIGVLIRQSDYREWDDGRFYFSSDQYAQWLRQVCDLHAGKRLAFVIASEVAQDEARFTGLPCHFATGNPGGCGHWFENWIELAGCDVIVTPPSTFSATAAFLGGVPLWPVLESSQQMALEQIIPDGMIGAARHPVFSRSVK